MQDPAGALQQIMKPEFPDQHEQLKCPRCDSTNTKFCYYNNYNLSQPRHFCKNCRRYWTKGGTLRNIPVGGGTRKNSKRQAQAQAYPNPNPDSEPEPAPPPARIKTSAESSPSWASDPSRIFMGDEDRKVVDVGGSFSSLLAANGSLGNLLEPDGSGLNRTEMGGLGGETESGQDPDGLESSKNGSTWWSGTSNDGWPHLSIYTPGSSFQ